MQKSMKVFIVIISIVLTLAVTVTAGLSVMTFLKVRALESSQAEELPEGGVEGEDDIEISGGYWIRSTKAISDAYLSGDSSALSERDKSTLDMASEILAEIITDPMTDYEKEKAVFEWMNRNIGEDAEVTVLVRSDISTDNPHGVLSGRSAVCVGYATTFRLFMQMLDIPCMVVHNTDLIHSWDLVQIDGGWYHVDLYSAQSESEPLVYLNRTDDMMLSMGNSWDTSFYPAADSLEHSYLYEIAKQDPVEDIYTVPSLFKSALEGEAAHFACILRDSGDTRELAEYLALNIESALMGAIEYQDYYFSHIVAPAGDHVILYMDIEQYSYDDIDSWSDISEEEQERADSAISDAFGNLTPYDDMAYDYDYSY